MSSKIRVLLVDDEKRFVEGMARLLKLRGFDVSTALSGYEAMDLLHREKDFDVVVLDVKMPGMDGIMTLSEIKKTAPDTEVIMLTGHATLSSGTQALRMGAYDYMMKPCDVEDLIEKIREAHEAESMKKNPVLWPRKLVSEMPLHPFRPLLPEDRVGRALEIMRRETGEETVEELFVVDEHGAPVGLVTKRHLLDLAGESHPEKDLHWDSLLDQPEQLPDRPVKELMKHAPPSVQGSASLTDAANRMILQNVRSMPVLGAGKVLGVIRLQDIFRVLEHEME